MSQYSTLLLMLTVLGLGFRHGFDLDHIATIDAMTRSIEGNRRFAKWVGFLFSLGHGLVVILVSLMIGSGLLQGVLPEWLDGFGQWISVFFLLVFGLLTLWNIRCNAEKPGLPPSLQRLFFKRIQRYRQNPLFVISVGALFAFSFDTISQVALFSLSAAQMAGWFFSMMIGVVFTLGMMASDGLNGLFVAKLIQKADKQSRTMSNIFGFLIAGFSLILGMVGLFRLLA